jgi:peptidoglycan/LPS O-acetylase OafA/YrhL
VRIGKSLVGPVTTTRTHQPAGRWFATVLVAALIGGWLMSAHVPVALVLPAMSIAMVVAGFATAATLYLAGSRMESFSPPWEVAGSLVFLGFAAAILTDTREALALFEQLEKQGLSALTR